MTDEITTCACGCGQPLKGKRGVRFVRGHFARATADMLKDLLPYCACGCGQKVSRARRRYASKAHAAKSMQQCKAKIEPVAALVLWNMGLNLRQIAANFPGCSRMAVKRAIDRACTLPGAYKRPSPPNGELGAIRYPDSYAKVDKDCGANLPT